MKLLINSKVNYFISGISFFKHSRKSVQDHKDSWEIIYIKTCEEIGVKNLYTTSGGLNKRELVEKYFEDERDVPIVLLILETILFTIRVLETRPGGASGYEYKDVVKDVNQRFIENSFGFRYENGTIIRIDNDLTHSQLTQPTLSLLSDPLYNCMADIYVYVS